MTYRLAERLPSLTIVREHSRYQDMNDNGKRAVDQIVLTRKLPEGLGQDKFPRLLDLGIVEPVPEVKAVRRDTDDGGRVPYREPASQAEHMKAIRESRTLKKNARLVAFEAHIQFGLTFAENKGRVPFGSVKRELTAEYLAMFTGLSRRATIDAMSEAVRLGFYRRIDNGKGGRGNTNRATYLPVVPAWVPTVQD
jgi:hypothetical protein